MRGRHPWSEPRLPCDRRFQLVEGKLLTPLRRPLGHDEHLHVVEAAPLLDGRPSIEALVEYYLPDLTPDLDHWRRPLQHWPFKEVDEAEARSTARVLSARAFKTEERFDKWWDTLLTVAGPEPRWAVFVMLPRCAIDLMLMALWAFTPTRVVLLTDAD